MISKSFGIAKSFLGREAEVIIGRPLGSEHPEFGFVYEVNYGYIEGAKAPDGEKLDAYYLGMDKPLQSAKGKVIAIIHRKNDDDDKLVVAANGFNPKNDKIKKLVDFQEKWFDYEIVRI
ncbi:MAG: inorganic diphosphatase [Candidatus Paceibacterota bacterium]